LLRNFPAAAGRKRSGSRRRAGEHQPSAPAQTQLERREGR